MARHVYVYMCIYIPIYCVYVCLLDLEDMETQSCSTLTPIGLPDLAAPDIFQPHAETAVFMATRNQDLNQVTFKSNVG